MALLCRKIEKLERWLNRPEELLWLPAGEIPADPLSDFKTDGNNLSVWEIAGDRSNLEQVALALAVNRNEIDTVAYVLFDDQIPRVLGIDIEQSAGRTLIEDINPWHRGLAHLSATKVTQLATQVVLTGETDEFLKKDILRSLYRAVTSGTLDELRLNRRQREQLESFRASMEAKA